MIRRIKAVDYKRCYEIIHDCIKFMRWDKETKKKLKRKYTLSRIKKMAGKSDFFVYENGGRVLASGRLERNTIYTLYVDPKHHRKKIGTSMMKYLEKIAKKKGVKKVKLYAIRTAIGFYKKMGYGFKNKKTGLMERGI